MPLAPTFSATRVLSLSESGKRFSKTATTVSLLALAGLMLLTSLYEATVHQRQRVAQSTPIAAIGADTAWAIVALVAVAFGLKTFWLDTPPSPLYG